MTSLYITENSVNINTGLGSDTSGACLPSLLMLRFMNKHEYANQERPHQPKPKVSSANIKPLQLTSVTRQTHCLYLLSIALGDHGNHVTLATSASYLSTRVLNTFFSRLFLYAFSLLCAKNCGCNESLCSRMEEAVRYRAQHPNHDLTSSSCQHCGGGGGNFPWNNLLPRQSYGM